ncbi:hypothetical protein ACHAXN_000300 [Cyclotella atomus]
MEAVNYGIT